MTFEPRNWLQRRCACVASGTGLGESCLSMYSADCTMHAHFPFPRYEATDFGMEPSRKTSRRRYAKYGSDRSSCAAQLRPANSERRSRRLPVSAAVATATRCPVSSTATSHFRRALPGENGQRRTQRVGCRLVRRCRRRTGPGAQLALRPRCGACRRAGRFGSSTRPERTALDGPITLAAVYSGEPTRSATSADTVGIRATRRTNAKIWLNLAFV